MQSSELEPVIFVTRIPIHVTVSLDNNNLKLTTRIANYNLRVSFLFLTDIGETKC
jgi:hypothetical protein